MCDLVARGDREPAIHQDREIHVISKANLADLAVVQAGNICHLSRDSPHIEGHCFWWRGVE